MSFNLQPPLEPSEPALAARIRRLAGQLDYPPTPDLASRERARIQASPARGRPAVRRPVRRAAGFVLLAVLILLGMLLAVQPVRARILDWLRIGAVRIFLVAPAPTLPATAAPPAAQTTGALEATLTPTPTSETGLDLAGETDLVAAARSVRFPLRLPEGQDEPTHVFVQETQGQPVVILVWTDPPASNKVRLALYEIGGESLFFDKQNVTAVQETTVNGQWALWVQGPHQLISRSGAAETRRLVEGHTLLWFEAGVTYRLETTLSLEDARRIAESLRPPP